MEEKRQFPRLAVRLMTIMKVLKSGRVWRVLTQNLGVGGLCFITEQQLETGEALEFEIHFPDTDNPCIVQAEVIWTRPTRERKTSYETLPIETGVKFTEISQKDIVQIKQYVSINAIPV